MSIQEQPLCIFVDFNGTLDTIKDPNAFFDQFASSLKEQGITKPVEFFIISKGAGVEVVESYVKDYKLDKRVHGYLMENCFKRFDASSSIHFNNGQDVITKYMRTPPENVLLVDNDKVRFFGTKEEPMNVKPLQIGALEKVVNGMEMDQALDEFAAKQFIHYRSDRDHKDMFREAGEKLTQLGHKNLNVAGKERRSIAQGVTHTTSSPAQGPHARNQPHK